MSIGSAASAVVGNSESQGATPQRTELGGDIFARGESWKNRGQVAGDPQSASGDWREKAAIRAYGAQQANGLGLAEAGGSAEAEAAAERSDRGDSSAAEEATEAAGEESAENKSSGADVENATPGQGELTPEEHRVVTELKIRDRQVRSHEQAHLAAAGGYATSGASFQYQSGPDGKRYAVGGEVSIDVSKESDPEQTMRKMSVVRAAALAPANPSSQDRSVAASATAGIVDAQRELQAMRTEEAEARRDEMTRQDASDEVKSDEGVSGNGAEGAVGGVGRRAALQYEANAASAGVGETADKKRPGIDLAV